MIVRLLVIATIAFIAAGCPPRTSPSGPGTVQFWSLVKITSGGSSFAFKCLHQRTDAILEVACFSPVEIPLFTVSIEGNRVVTATSSLVVSEQIPFDVGLIGKDVWRAHVASSDADLAAYDELNEPDLPEDHMTVTSDDRMRPILKVFTAGDAPVVEIRFFDYPPGSSDAARIEIQSQDPAYDITIVQGMAG